MVQHAAHTFLPMVQRTDYKDRIVEAMARANVDPKQLSKAVGISYQAVMKLLAGTSKMMRADNNVVAARFLGVDSEWLATGEGTPVGQRSWPFTQELLEASRAAPPAAVRKAENAARNALDMDLLPRLETTLAA